MAAFFLSFHSFFASIIGQNFADCSRDFALRRNAVVFGLCTPYSQIVGNNLALAIGDKNESNFLETRNVPCHRHGNIRHCPGRR
jgi:hypothetical protein